MAERSVGDILVRDAMWSTIDSGTAKIGIITSGKEPMRKSGASSENIWKRLGALKNPVASATTRSLMPNQFHSVTNRSLPRVAGANQ